MGGAPAPRSLARSPAPGGRAARDGGGAVGSPPSLRAEAQPSHSSGLLVTRLPLPWASPVSPESSWLTLCLPGDYFSTPESQAGRWHSVYSLSACPQGRAKPMDTRACAQRPGGVGPSGTPLRASLSCLPAGKWHLGHHGSHHPNFRGKDSLGDWLPGKQRCLCEETHPGRPLS